MVFQVPDNWTPEKAAEYACRVFGFEKRTYQQFVEIRDAVDLLQHTRLTLSQIVKLVYENDEWLALSFEDRWMKLHPERVMYLALLPLTKRINKQINAEKRTIAACRKARLQLSQKSQLPADTGVSKKKD